MAQSTRDSSKELRYPENLDEICIPLMTIIDLYAVKPRFGECSTCFECETKTGVVLYEFWLFFKIDLRSAISFKRSWRELSIDVAEHRSMLKNYQNTLYPRFSFIPKTGIFQKRDFLFLLCIISYNWVDLEVQKTFRIK